MPNELVTSFIAAVRRGDVDAVLAALTTNPELTGACDSDCFGATPLIHSANRNDLAMVDLLLQHGADIDQRSDWSNGPFSVLDGASDDMAEQLLARGATLTPHAAARLGKFNELRAMLDADPSRVHERGGDGQLPLHFCRTSEIADLLLQRGADIEARDIDHNATAAQWLATTRPRVAAHLLTRGAKSDPVLCAVAGDIARLEMVVRSDPEGANMRITRERFPGPSPAAGHIYLFTIGDGCTLLHAAVNANNVESVRWLLANGADANIGAGYDAQTPLHVAAWRDCSDVGPLLIAAGANINAPSGPIHRNQPVGWAIVAGSERMVRILLDAGAELRDEHREDAVAGAKGRFRAWSPQRSIEAWGRIKAMIEAQKQPG